MTQPVNMLLQLPFDLFRKILCIINEAEHTPGCSIRPSLLALYRTSRELRRAMLPLIGSTRLILEADTGLAGRDLFTQGFLTQLGSFPSAATLRVLKLEIGTWADDLADAMLDERVALRLATVADLAIIRRGDVPGQPTNWRVICGMAVMAFPGLTSLALMMDVPPTLFVVRQLRLFPSLVDLRVHCVVPPATRVDPAVASVLGSMTRLRSLSLLQATDFGLCLYGMVGLTNLRSLRLFSEIPLGILDVDLPQFSALATCMPHLTDLVWAGAGGCPPGVIPTTTLAAIGCITQLVQLDIHDHDVQVRRMGGLKYVSDF